MDTTDDRLSSTMLRQLRQSFEVALKEFHASSDQFRVAQSIPSSSSSSHPFSSSSFPLSSLSSSSVSSSHTSSSPSSTPTSSSTDFAQARTTRSLYVLDSSFNPPSKAHLLLAFNALTRDAGRKVADGDGGGNSKRLLLLLATNNADKKPQPADFEDRLVMMTLMARDLSRTLAWEGSSCTGLNGQGAGGQVIIDVGVTKMPFYVDKAVAIDGSGIYGGEEGEGEKRVEKRHEETRIRRCQQVHVTGYDTIVRIFNAKYYPSDIKLGVLSQYFDRGHRLRVSYRPGEKFGTREDQDAYLEGIGDGSREDEGMNRQWRDQIEMVEPAKDSEGVSSTKARRAAVDEDWKGLEELVGEEVAAYVKERGLYADKGDVEKR